MKARLWACGLVLAISVFGPAASSQTIDKPLQFKVGVDRKAQGFVNFLNVIKELAGGVKEMAQGAAKGIDGGPAAFAEAGGLFAEGILSAIAAAVKDPNVQRLLAALSGRVSEAARVIGEKGFDASALVGQLVSIAEPLLQFVVARLPLADASVRRLITGAVSSVVAALRDPSAFKAEFLDQPWAMVKAAVSMVREFAREKLGTLVAQAHLGPERDLLVGTVDAVFELLVDDARRESFFGAKGRAPSARPLLELLVGVAKPYLTSRLRGLTAGTGLEDAIDLAVDALLGPEGPVLKGAAFLPALQKTLATEGAKIFGKIVGALSSFLEMQILRAGRGPAVMGLLRGILGVVKNVLTSREGLAGLGREGPAAVIARLADIIGPLIEAMAPKGQAHPALDFVRTVATGLLKVLADVRSIPTKSAQVLESLAAEVARAVKAAVEPLVAALPMDKAIKPILGRAVAALFALWSGPKRTPATAGTLVLAALREGARMLLPFVLVQLQRGLPPALRDLPAALFDELNKLLTNPQRLRSLHSAKATDLLARIFEVLGKPAARLVEAALPASLRPALQTLLGEVVAAMANPTRGKQLFARTTAAWLAALKQTGIDLLGKLLGLIPDAPKQAIRAALTRVAAALTNVASLTSATGTAARQALDQTLSGLAMRVPDGAAREIAIELASLLRDLVGAGAQPNALRNTPAALFARLLRGGARALTRAIGDLVPEGAVRTMLLTAADALSAFAANPKTMKEAGARVATAALTRVAVTLAGAARSALRAALPNPAVATLVDSLFEVGTTALLQPARWAELQKNGIDALLARLVPVFTGFLLPAMSQAAGNDTVRTVVDSVLRAVAEVFAPRRAGTTAGKSAAAQPPAQNTAARLVGLGVATLKNLVGGLIDGSGVSAQVSAAVRSLLGWAGDLITQPAKLAATLRKKASDLLAGALSEGQALLIGLVTDAVSDAALKTLVRGTLTQVGAGIAGALRGGAAGLGAQAKEILAGALEPLAAFFREKVLALLGGPKGGAAASFVGDAYDALVSFATDMLKNPAAWQTRVGADGKRLLGQLARWAFASLSRALGPSLRVPALRGLVERWLSTTGALFGEIGALVAAARTPGGIARLLVPKLIGVVKPLIDDELIARLPAGILRDVLGAAANEGLRLLADVDSLARIPTMRWDDVKKKLGEFLKTRVVPPVVAALKLGPVVQGILNAGLDRLIR